MKVMESLAILLISIFLGSIQNSCSIRTIISLNNSRHDNNVSSKARGFSFPMYPKSHPEIQRHFKSLGPQAVAPFSADDGEGDDHVYYVRFGVGTPTTLVVGALDTASDLTWFARSQFEPSNSRTYSRLRCNTSMCGYISGMCFENTWCCYERSYADGSLYRGQLGFETFFFYEADDIDGYEPNSTVKFKMSFGTKNDDDYDHKGRVLGIMSVSNNDLSLLRYLDVTQFSTFFPLSRDETSYVRFGEDAHLWGDSTPLVEYGQYKWKFHFNVKSIRVGEIEVTNLSMLTSSETQNGHPFLFDTGAAFTYLSPVAMDGVVDAVKRSLDAVPEPYGVIRDFELCYLSYAPRILRMLRELEFSFELDGGGSPIEMVFDNIWIHTKGVYCLAFIKYKTQQNKNIFGNRQMMGYNFGFDVSLGKLYYEIGCDAGPIRLMVLAETLNGRTIGY